MSLEDWVAARRPEFKVVAQKRAASNYQTDRALEIVRDFIVRKKLVIYGGLAIDYALRLKSENFEPYFERRKKLMPKPTDLSYYNWETQTSTSNSTPMMARL